MSSGRSRQRAGSRKGQKTTTHRQAQAGLPSSPKPPPRSSTSEARSPLVLWGSLIIGVFIVAFVGFLFIAPIVFPQPKPTPTPDVAPTSTDLTPDLAPGGTSTPGAPSGRGRIAFVRTDSSSGLRSLYVVNVDGSNQQRVTDAINVEGTIAWSPDGNSIIMQAGIEGISTVVRLTIGPDNKMTDSAQLTADAKADSAIPAWSPDGKMIAFQSKRDTPLFQIWVMNVDGSNKRRLSDGNGFAGQPQWSPDSKFVVYAQGEQQTNGAAREIYTVPVGGGAPTKITSVGGSLSSPTWSPDGKSIACTQLIDTLNYKLLMMNTDGSNLRTLDEGQIIRTPYFSPQGDLILYYTISNVGNNITIHNLTTDRTTSLTKNQGDNYNPSWSPDGTMITWASGSPHKIVTANNDGTERSTVSTGEGDDSQPVWAVPR